MRSICDSSIQFALTTEMEWNTEAIFIIIDAGLQASWIIRWVSFFINRIKTQDRKVGLQIKLTVTKIKTQCNRHS